MSVRSNQPIQELMIRAQILFSVEITSYGVVVVLFFLDVMAKRIHVPTPIDHDTKLSLVWQVKYAISIMFS